jgi:uncharacterized protein YjiS (DUF1127 family)
MTTATAAKSPAGFLVAGVERNTGTARASLRRAWADYRAYRATLGELGSLTDRQLGDLGLTRGEIGATARRAVYGN